MLIRWTRPEGARPRWRLDKAFSESHNKETFIIEQL